MDQSWGATTKKTFSWVPTNLASLIGRTHVKVKKSVQKFVWLSISERSCPFGIDLNMRAQHFVHTTKAGAIERERDCKEQLLSLRRE